MVKVRKNPALRHMNMMFLDYKELTESLLRKGMSRQQAYSYLQEHEKPLVRLKNRIKHAQRAPCTVMSVNMEGIKLNYDVVNYLKSLEKKGVIEIEIGNLEKKTLKAMSKPSTLILRKAKCER
jgi:hypothetical protein